MALFRVAPGRGSASTPGSRRRGGGRNAGEDRGRALGAERGQDGPDQRPVPGRLGQAGGDHPAEPPVGQPGEVRRFGKDAEHDRGRLVAAERRPARGGERQRAAQGEHVAGRPGRITPQLLGGHVGERAYYRAGRGDPGGRVDGPGDAEVGDPRPVRGHDHVARLEVPVYQPAGTDRGQPFGQPRPQRPHLIRRQRPAPADRLLQRRPLDVRRLPSTADPRADPHPPPARYGTPRPAPPPRPPGQTAPGTAGPGVHRVDQLDRDLPAARRHPQVHLPHPAGAQPAQQPVAAHAGRITGPGRFHRQARPPSHPPREQTVRIDGYIRNI